ncbi:phosphotransferase family protein [Tessaracoccus sp. OH4464_COT-324]|uniref:phosphotransferase family protein n=1 Tax=Tessaracoccus sp. OH4464_COT-324 TaxID=2491059 RepID=UPI001319D0A1|nr:phosphotransferase [Tessaracoccus sp. OH4464_COT-324]
MTSALATAEVFFDEDLLSTTLGRPARAVGIRHKAWHSTLATLEFPDGGSGWALAVAPVELVKVDNTLRRARRSGYRLPVVETEHATIVYGRAESDTRLLGAAREAAPFLQDATLVRYNPARRALYRARWGEHIVGVRLHAQEGEAAALADRALQLRAGRVSTIAAMAADEHVSVWPWQPGGDLLAYSGDRTGWARRAGRELAAVHRVGATTVLQPGRQLAQLATDLGQLDPYLGRRFAELLARRELPQDDLVSCHGDFSADQILVGRGVKLIDFDRFTMAPRGLDIGSYHAVEILHGQEPTTEHLVGGYGQPVAWQQWVFVGLANRVLDPFREANPRWRELISDRLNQLGEWL